MDVKSTFLELEKVIFHEINSKFVEIGLEKGYYSIHNMKVDWIQGTVGINGYDKMKGDDFFLTYDYDLKDGEIRYWNNSYSEKIKNI